MMQREYYSIEILIKFNWRRWTKKIIQNIRSRRRKKGLNKTRIILLCVTVPAECNAMMHLTIFCSLLRVHPHIFLCFIHSPCYWVISLPEMISIDGFNANTNVSTSLPFTKCFFFASKYIIFFFFYFLHLYPWLNIRKSHL